jgi:ParB family transcriptional regulator, chromosome partitioning protein
MMKRQALGKGLSSLIPEPILDRKGEAGLLMLDIDRIQPNPFQPRTDFGGLEGLVSSIRENGVVQPVIVRQDGDGYQLIAGERRWRAAQLAGMQKIPAIVRKLADDRLLEVALIENIQRKELNPIEEAKAYEILLSQMKLSQSEVARRVGRDRSSISNSLRILKLHDTIQNLLRDGQLSVGHAKAIMAIPDAATQIKVATEVAQRLLSVRETEERIASLLQRGTRQPGRTVATGRGNADPNVRAAEDRLCRALATKVRIVDRGGGGRIEIEFYSADELQRLYGFLVTAEKGH